jgi:hypothetical protein
MSVTDKIKAIMDIVSSFDIKETSFEDIMMHTNYCEDAEKKRLDKLFFKEFPISRSLLNMLLTIRFDNNDDDDHKSMVCFPSSYSDQQCIEFLIANPTNEKSLSYALLAVGINFFASEKNLIPIPADEVNAVQRCILTHLSPEDLEIVYENSIYRKVQTREKFCHFND